MRKKKTVIGGQLHGKKWKWRHWGPLDKIDRGLQVKGVLETDQEIDQPSHPEQDNNAARPIRDLSEQGLPRGYSSLTRFLFIFNPR